jgi:hypothetical protein
MVVWKMLHTSLGYDKVTEIREDNINASFHFETGTTIPHHRIPGYQEMYSRQLCELVEHCLMVNLDQRLEIVELVDRTRDGFERCLRVMGRPEGAVTAEHLSLETKNDEDFNVGTVFEQPVEKKRKMG